MKRWILLSMVSVSVSALAACQGNKNEGGGGTVPTISSCSPTSGQVGTEVTIAGTNFSATAANNTVKFNDVAATVINSTADMITTSAPAGATTGPITVTVGGQTAASATNFTVTPSVIPEPLISGFTPTSGPVGTSVTITGANFSATAADNTVRFNGATATVTNSTTTSITTSVPGKATTGAITVTAGGLVVVSTTNFTVAGGPVNISGPFIAGFNPTSGGAGDTVIISGAGFSATPANNIVRFYNNKTATVTSSTGTSITTSVPGGAITGPVSVTVSGLTGTSAANFIVPGGTAEEEPNDTSVEAQVIYSPAEVHGSTSGSNGSNPDFDYYAISPLASNIYIISLTSGATGDLDLYLYDSSLNQLGYSANQGDGGTETMTYPLNYGTYYIRVVPWSTTAATTYTLTVQEQ